MRSTTPSRDPAGGRSASRPSAGGGSRVSWTSCCSTRADVGALRRLVLRVINGFGLGHAEDELARETAAHLALVEDDFRRRGLSPDDARLAARRAFGGVEQ